MRLREIFLRARSAPPGQEGQAACVKEFRETTAAAQTGWQVRSPGTNPPYGREYTTNCCCGPAVPFAATTATYCLLSFP